MNHNPGLVQNTSSTSNNIKSNIDTVDAFTTLMGPLNVFNSIVDEIADVQYYLYTYTMTDFLAQLHPYAKEALSTLSNASKVRSFS